MVTIVSPKGPLYEKNYLCNLMIVMVSIHCTSIHPLYIYSSIVHPFIHCTSIHPLYIHSSIVHPFIHYTSIHILQNYYQLLNQSDWSISISYN